MCGIAGIYDENLSREEMIPLMEKMLALIKHRGPDYTDFKFYSPVMLGHNRLSIIDLSADANQPMEYQNLSITYNGEIYNYIELKEELKKYGYAFRTHSDTEVILASFLHWEENCVNHFVGMWAFAIWDNQKKILFCSRDRFGIKPFYYIHQNNRFYFSSEYGPLKASPIFSSELNLKQISRGLQLGWLCYQDETYFTQIKSLPSAHNLILQNGKVKIYQYWNIDFSKREKVSFEEKKEKFFELFSDSVTCHLRSDVTVGACLSGGLDSSSIASMVAHLFPKQSYKTFSIYYEGKDEVDERPFIYEVIKKYPMIEPYYITPNDKTIEENFHHALQHAEVPATISAFISQYFVMKLIAEQKIRVVLDGQGADEYMAGYMHSYYRLLADQLRKFHITSVIKILSELKNQQQYSVQKTVDVLFKSLLTSFCSENYLYQFEYRRYYPFLCKSDETCFHLSDIDESKLNQFLYHLTFNTSLPSLLHYEDRNSMAFSIESRVPFLDHRLVEFVFSLDDGDKIHNAETKHIMRKSLEKILPDAVTNRKDKKGFVTPGENKWLRGALKFLIEDGFSRLDMINLKKAKRILDEYKKGNDKNALMVWRLAVLNYWIKNFA